MGSLLSADATDRSVIWHEVCDGRVCCRRMRRAMWMPRATCPNLRVSAARRTVRPNNFRGAARFCVTEMAPWDKIDGTA